ncbi:hypothetical protein ABIA45_005435 [Bradyrhizobium sp. USDA 336]
MAADVVFLPDHGIDRQHVALAAGLHAVAAEEQHDDAVAGDPGLQAVDGPDHVVAGRIFHHVDVEAVLAQRRGQRTGVVDRLRQRRAGVGIMSIADDEREARGLADRTGDLVGRDRLGGIDRTHVESSMGADHQRHRADEGRGEGDRTSGKVELLYIHLASFPVPKTIQARAHCLSSAIASLGLRDWPGKCPRIARNLRRRTKQTLNRI